MSQPQGEIFDLGYQHYDGPRGGRLQAVWSLWTNGFRTTLGLGRGARAKILPALMSLVAIAPSAVFLVLAAVMPFTPPASEAHVAFFRATAILLLLFAAIIAPELLIPDRRSGVFTLYLVRPLTAFDYVAARWSAFLIVILAVTLCGQVLILAANLLLAEAPNGIPKRELAGHTALHPGRRNRRLLRYDDSHGGGGVYRAARLRRGLRHRGLCNHDTHVNTAYNRVVRDLLGDVCRGAW